MLTVDKISVMNIENAIRGVRNPLNSWDKSDSHYGCVLFGREFKCLECNHNNNCGAESVKQYILGENDLKLLTKLCKAGSDHRKFMRQIFVSMDINAPLYWWKEFDTYKVGTTANSTSTMHKIHAKEFTLDDFSCDKMTDKTKDVMKYVIVDLNCLRELFLETKDKVYWYSMIQLLPGSYNQLRTVTLTYENLLNIYHARRNHKLTEWHTLCNAIEKLPYAKELIVDIKG
ncbi:MAG: hypothetical protein ACRDD7_16910 [Peptostreptococcaceae bacterium]